MINSDFYEKLAKIFCGDELDIFTKKTGPQLVHFFNNNFSSHDTYGPGFPTRWRYVNQKILEFSSVGKFDSFLNLILSKNYLLTERQISEIDALVHQQKILVVLNKLCSVYSLKLARRDGVFKLVEIDLDLVEVGKGGFANIYLQKSTGLILKKLNEDSIGSSSLRSRFKREYEITKSCGDIPSIIRVYDFDLDSCSYTMERADSTLEDFVKESSLSDDSKINIIRQILYTMSLVHQRGVLHRDLSPTNIFFVDNTIKLADFGLGKNLNTLTSHQTMDTASFGQLFYCAPEQLTLLKDADKRSDVFSLGRIINFVMTKDPNDFSHFLRSVSEKATNLNPDYRYDDATDMLSYLNRWLHIRTAENFETMIWDKIESRGFDSDVESYIYQMTGADLCKKCILQGSIFVRALLHYMQMDEENGKKLIQSIDSIYKDFLKDFKNADVFANLSYQILKGDYHYSINEVAADILRYVAYEVNRFHAQDKIEELLAIGVEPFIEEILERY